MACPRLIAPLSPRCSPSIRRSCRVICGHVHRTVFGEIGGRPLLACPSTYLQARLDLRVPGEIELRPETAGFALHAWLGDQLVSHVQPLG